MKKSLVAMIPMYSRVAGGVSAPTEAKDAPPSTKPAALMKFPDTAIALELAKVWTAV